MAFRDPLHLKLQAGFRHAWVSCHPNPRCLGPRAANPAPPRSIGCKAFGDHRAPGRPLDDFSRDSCRDAAPLRVKSGSPADIISTSDCEYSIFKFNQLPGSRHPNKIYKLEWSSNWTVPGVFRGLKRIFSCRQGGRPGPTGAGPAAPGTACAPVPEARGLERADSTLRRCLCLLRLRQRTDQAAAGSNLCDFRCGKAHAHRRSAYQCTITGKDHLQAGAPGNFLTSTAI